MPKIHHQLIIGTPAKTVYNALTTQAGLAAWWTPQTVAIPEIGSISQFGFGPAYVKKMKVVDLRPFEWVQWFCLEATEEWKGTTVAFALHEGDRTALQQRYPEMHGQLQQQEDGKVLTLLIFEHDKWKEATSMFGECSYTWALFLRSLKSFCEFGKGRPYPHQHRFNDE